jgi:alkanesulfonate monooxygenase SsuD/methylene tetrahydromethanopterin reductase-like flavin-dependent oxidoreductase (luciferase family)
VLLAKQLASVDVIAGGRIVLGVGAGWLAEEFAALEVDFITRGARMDTSISVLRECWTGTLGAGNRHIALTEDIAVQPVPRRPIPVLVGGMSGPAFRRVAASGDGWIAQASADGQGVAAVLQGLERLAVSCRDADRDPAGLRIAVRLSGALDVDAALLRALAHAGVDDVVLDAPGWGEESAALIRARDAAA